MEPNHRRCVSCGQTGPRLQFWRVVRTHPTGAVQLDQGMGRSAYLCPTADCLKVAQKKRRFSRALKATVSPSLYDRLWERLGAVKGR